jgi:hypothetical protein
MEVIYVHEEALVLRLKVGIGFKWAKQVEKRRNNRMIKCLSKKWTSVWGTRSCKL